MPIISSNIILKGGARLMSMSWGITQIYLPTKFAWTHAKYTTRTTGALLGNNCPANITGLNDIGHFKRFAWILCWDVPRLNYQHTLLTMPAVGDRMLNLITHLLFTPPIERKGRTQCRRTRAMRTSVAHGLDTSYNQWTLHVNHYIIHSYIKFQWLNTDDTLQQARK